MHHEEAKPLAELVGQCWREIIVCWRDRKDVLREFGLAD